jgi:KaiC/GvpD/RAD55 family RecA-like ATPase
MSYSENISSPSEKNEIPNSNLNLLNEGLFDNYLLNFNQLLNKKTDKTEKVSIKKNINNIIGNSRNKDNKNSFMLNNSLFFDDEEEIPKTKEKKKKKEKIKEKRYIVDNIENILTKLTKPKKKTNYTGSFITYNSFISMHILLDIPIINDN